MTAANDAKKKTTVQADDVRNINGMNVYLDQDGNIIRTEKRKEKKKSFAAATDKLNAQMTRDSVLSPAEILALQNKQND